MSNKASKYAPRKIVAGLRLSSTPTMLIQNLEAINRTVRFGKQLNMDEYTVKFVPGSKLTVFVAENLFAEDQTTYPMVAQIQKRTGSLTGKERDVIIIRRLNRKDAVQYPIGELNFIYQGNFLHIGCAEYESKYETVQTQAVDGEGICIDLQKKYFAHLTVEQARGVGRILSSRLKETPMTLVAAYRLAGRMLYDFSRGQGWVKLDNRQRRKYNTQIHWLKVDEFFALKKGKEWNSSGAGDYTLDSARS